MSSSSYPSGPSARDRSRRRKWIYGVSMIVLIVVLFVLSRPATLSTNEAKGQPGGVLAQYRDEHHLSQTELGQIDPTSETIRLATLGMRGIAGTTLWWKATQYQMKKDWTSLRATLDQISKLQPHSIDVWRYQAWNLSYNVSVAFDDYHDKFYWVIAGLDFMLEGVGLNDRVPRLYWDMAWFISNKIGRDDAAKYYRRLFSGGENAPDYVKEFRERPRFTPPTGFPPNSDLRDNWQVGKAWFKAAESKIDPPRYPVRGMAPVIFYSDAPTCQFYYADNLEKDGTFGQVAQRAWRDAEDEWREFGERAIETSYEIKLQLNRREELYDAAEEKKDRLDALVPGVRDELESKKRDKLSPEERAVWDKYRQALDKFKIENKTRGNNGKRLWQPDVDVDLKGRAEARPDEIVRRADTILRHLPPARRQEATKLAKEIEADETLAMYINRERSKVNFDFWRTRARAEQTRACLAAREAIHDGDRAYAKGDLIRARPLYEEGLRGWRKVLDDAEFRVLVEDVCLGGDLMDVIRRYQVCLAQDDHDLPLFFIDDRGVRHEGFILQDIIEKHGARQGSPFPPVGKKAPATEKADKKDAPPPANGANAEKADKKGEPPSANRSQAK